MLIFSETTFAFVSKAENFLRDIIKLETDITIKISRFTHKGLSCPLRIVIFTESNKLGYFDPHTHHIALNLNLIYTVKDSVLKDILRHEFAHYINSIENPGSLPHGSEYQEICKRYNWERSISKSTMDVEVANDSKEGDLASEKIINRIKNLLKLAESANVHEAELATLKANQLLLKHNIEKFSDLNNQAPLYTKQILIEKRRSSKLTSIYDILKHFLVSPIFIYGKKQVALEVSGSKENIELASYVANFLDVEMENQWNLVKSPTLKGVRAKNSFFLGMAKGYDQKINNMLKGYSPQERQALVKIKGQMQNTLKQVYKSITQTSSGASLDDSAYSSGITKGHKLTINKAVKNKSPLTSLLSWRN